MFKNIAAALIFMNSLALACEVTLPSHLVVLGDENGKTSLRTEHCSQKLLNDLHEILVNVEGKISSKQVSEMLTLKGHDMLVRGSSLIHVKQLKSLIREQIKLPPGIQVKSATSFDGNLIELSADDEVEVACPSCSFGAAQLLQVNIKGLKGNIRTLRAHVDFKKMVRAYQLTSTLQSFSEIHPGEVLKEVYVESVPHTDLITDSDKVRFYKTNKTIKSGELLKMSDLNAINLVRAGIKTQVILENRMVRIKTQGISRSNGTLGEQVEVFHQEKNKKYLGKVIDLNKVLVEL